MSEDKKVCTKCKELKLLSEYHRLMSGKDGLRNKCKFCINELAREVDHKQTKICTNCKIVKSVRDFFRHKQGKYGVSSCCRTCLSLIARQRKEGTFEPRVIQTPEERKETSRAGSRRRYAENPNKHKAIARKVLYKISQEEYETMCITQAGQCKICKGNSTRLSGILDIDHCHETGRVRGLLCHRCNLLLGAVRDSADLLRSAANYLEVVPNG